MKVPSDLSVYVHHLPLTWSEALLQVLYLSLTVVGSWVLDLGTRFVLNPWSFWGLVVPALASYYLRMVWAAGLVLRWVAWFCWVTFLRHTTLGWAAELGLAWLMRGSRAPPPVVRAELVNVSGVPAPVVHTDGLQYATASQVVHASITSGGFTPARLRRRARWVSSLQDYLGGRDGCVGRLVKGRWLPDLPETGRPASVNAVLATLDGGAKLLGGGAVRTTDPAICEPFLVVQMEHGREIIVPNLLGSLCRHTFGRERDAALLATLRSRAIEWCKDKKVCSFEQPLLIPGHVALALRSTAPERFAQESLAAAGLSLCLDR